MIFLKGEDNADEQDPLPNDEDAYAQDNEATITLNVIPYQSNTEATTFEATTIDVLNGINEKLPNG